MIRYGMNAEQSQTTDRRVRDGFAVGQVRCDSRLVLAPMAGITDLPFRILCRRYGAGLVVSEMVSAEGLARGQHGSSILLKTALEERPVAFQLFGSKLESMAAAAAILGDHGADLVDINMGCPVKKVVCRGAGSALMQEPETARRIMGAVVGASKVPVTVKIRAGWDTRSVNAVEFAKMAQDEGVSAVTVHGRTSRQMFGGKADLSVIRAVKEAVSIPVIGNGDVILPEDIRRMLDETGCDGVMVGRGTLGNPWIFRTQMRPSRGTDRLAAFLELAELMGEYADEKVILVKVKKHAQWFAKGIPGAAEFRALLYRDAPTVEHVVGLAKDFLGSPRMERALTNPARSGVPI